MELAFVVFAGHFHCLDLLQHFEHVHPVQASIEEQHKFLEEDRNGLLINRLLPLETLANLLSDLFGKLDEIFIILQNFASAQIESPFRFLPLRGHEPGLEFFRG